MKELKTVTMLLGTMLTKEELDDFMAEADAVSKIPKNIQSPCLKVLVDLPFPFKWSTEDDGTWHCVCFLFTTLPNILI